MKKFSQSYYYKIFFPTSILLFVILGMVVSFMTTSFIGDSNILAATADKKLFLTHKKDFSILKTTSADGDKISANDINDRESANANLAKSDDLGTLEQGKSVRENAYSVDNKDQQSQQEQHVRKTQSSDNKEQKNVLKDLTDRPSESAEKEGSSTEGIRTATMGADLAQCERNIHQDWERKLRLLLKKCDEYDMPLEKEISRRFLVRTKENGFVIAKIPSKPFLEQLPEDASAFQISWHKALQRLRKETAEKIYQLGEIYLQKKEGFEAFRLFRLALSIDSDHQGARQRFGYALIDGQWLSPYEQNQRVKGLVNHEKFGWLDKEDLARYENGERRVNEHWYSAEKEIEVRRRRHLGWRAETDHYQLMTEHSLEEGVRIIRILENYYQAWLSLFYRFTASESQWNLALQKNHLPSGRKHKIFLFANREAYLREVRKMDPSGQIEMSQGGYFPDVRCIYVYLPNPGEEVELETMLVHEATHQLFEECRNELDTSFRARRRKKTPIAQNFWILEGSATYMETFQDDGMNYHLGGLDSPRFLRARERVFEPGGTLPLRQYAQLSARSFQSHKNLPMLYTQAAGLTLFFLHYENGKYRNVFINYLYMVYERIDKTNTLEVLTGRSFEELDQEYQSFMKNLKTENNSEN